MGDKTATERLRALLDERGVEYRWDNGTATWYVDGVMYNAWGYDNERLTMSVCHLTPEQAIAATLDSCNWSNNCTNGERVVRCRGCESATDHCEGMDVYWCEYLSRYVGADTFCAWGVRKEGE